MNRMKFCHLSPTQMDLEDYVEWNKSDKDKYSMLSFICGIWKIKQMSEYNTQKLTGIEYRLEINSGERENGRSEYGLMR